MTYSIEIDRNVCNGYGNCVVAAPEVFEVDPKTYIARVQPGRPVELDEADVEEAAADCPVRAIRLRRS
ncbi:ferredoxin [Amycolatopsis albispora]|uniref:Ferredoxin n=1 Tax=Amycolatopsis albispora TaxID=1804986 RepID=A0A344L014_9PSEU|nr:ferredoxin [Amycolatopsis albispora]AXB41388.1 hypothetical protein A4R43_01660 [Amycolatopsis albispora]